MDIHTIEDFHTALEAGPYAFPGMYPLFFVMADGEALSFEAAEMNADIIEETINGDRGEAEWLPLSVEINYEDDNLLCAHTGERIESAYEPAPGV